MKLVAKIYSLRPFFISHMGMWGSEAQLYAVSGTVDGNVWAASRSDCFVSPGRVPNTNWVGGFMCTRFGLKALEKSLFTLMGIEVSFLCHPGLTPVISPVRPCRNECVIYDQPVWPDTRNTEKKLDFPERELLLTVSVNLCNLPSFTV